jgi:hypothetical protein
MAGVPVLTVWVVFACCFDGSKDLRIDLADAIVDVDFIDMASDVLALYWLDEDMTGML